MVLKLSFTSTARRQQRPILLPTTNGEPSQRIAMASSSTDVSTAVLDFLVLSTGSCGPSIGRQNRRTFA